MDNGVIRMSGVTGEEQGAYICTATNAAGTVTATANLKIQGTHTVWWAWCLHGFYCDAPESEL